MCYYFTYVGRGKFFSDIFINVIFMVLTYIPFFETSNNTIHLITKTDAQNSVKALLALRMLIAIVFKPSVITSEMNLLNSSLLTLLEILLFSVSPCFLCLGVPYASMARKRAFFIFFFCSFLIIYLIICKLFLLLSFFSVVH